jgi:hypothetical protein
MQSVKAKPNDLPPRTLREIVSNEVSCQRINADSGAFLSEPPASIQPAIGSGCSWRRLRPAPSIVFRAFGAWCVPLASRQTRRAAIMLSIGIPCLRMGSAPILFQSCDIGRCPRGREFRHCHARNARRRAGMAQNPVGSLSYAVSKDSAPKI